MRKSLQFTVYSLQVITWQAILIAGVIFVSCNSTPKNVTMVNELPKIYPDYIGVTIPAEVAPLNFNSTEENVGCIDVVVKGNKGGGLHAQ